SRRFECFTSGIVLRIGWYSCKTFGCDLYGVRRGDCNGIVSYSSFYRKKKQTDRRELRDTKEQTLVPKSCRLEWFTSGIVLRISWYSCKTFGCDLYGVRRGDCNGIVSYSSFYRKKKQTVQRELSDTKVLTLVPKISSLRMFYIRVSVKVNLLYL